MKRAADIIAVLPDAPPNVVDAIYRLDARAYGNSMEISEAELAGEVRRRVAAAGSESKLAAQIGVTRQMLNDYTAGRRGAGPTLLRALRLRRIRRGAVFVPTDDI